MTRRKMKSEQSLVADDFFYFFLRLRKVRIRSVVERVRRLYPGESPAQHARRLIDSSALLSLAAGTVFHVPGMIPGAAAVYRGLGFVAGASVLTRMQLYLILEIALLHGKDIDDAARVPELIAVVTAAGAGMAASPLLVEVLEFHPLLGLALGGATATALTRLIGEAAIKYYSAPAGEPAPAPAPAPAASGV